MGSESKKCLYLGTCRTWHRREFNIFLELDLLSYTSPIAPQNPPLSSCCSFILTSSIEHTLRIVFNDKYKMLVIITRFPAHLSFCRYCCLSLWACFTKYVKKWFLFFNMMDWWLCVASYTSKHGESVSDLGLCCFILSLPSFREPLINMSESRHKPSAGCLVP